MPDEANYIPDFDFSHMMRVIDEAEKIRFEHHYYKALIEQLHPELIIPYQEIKN